MSGGGREIRPGLTIFVAVKDRIIMEISGAGRKPDPAYLEKAISYEAYKLMVDELLAQGRTTGPNQSEAFIHYTQLNQQRMHRLEKTTEVLPAVKEAIGSILRAQTWLVLTEAWCGDAAQSLPVIYTLSRLNPLIDLRLLLRDENLELMDMYLTNGTSRSIPKLIGLDTATGEERFTWGPRPAALQESFMGMRSEGLPYDVIKEELQRWYNKDKTISIQQELAGLAAPLHPLP
jgi:hypothetical protein